MIIRNQVIAFLCGTLLSAIACIAITYNTVITTSAHDTAYSSEVLSEDFDNPSGFSATKTDHHGVKYTSLYFGKIARSVDEELLSGISVDHFYDDMLMAPDWGYYANCIPDTRESVEHTEFYDEVHVSSKTDYYYIIDDELIEEQIFAYFRILREAGYELHMSAPWGAIYQKDGWYIQIGQNYDMLYHKICISISENMYGL